MIRLLTASLLAGLCLAACREVVADDDFQSLFNGRDLNGWRGDAAYWTVQNGAITATTTADNPLKYNTFLIWEGGQPANFVLNLKFRIVGGNSGVQYRSRVIDEEKFVVSGYQADIDSSPRYSGIMYEEKARGILAERGQSATITGEKDRSVIAFGDAAELQNQAIRPEEWNDYLIVARGRHMQHFVNGILLSETIDESSKHAESGIIALQAHQGPPMTVQFKDIQLKELPSN
jgi:Domain of Unknown Function (DUF1080)